MLSLLLLLSVGRAVLPTLATTCSGSPPPPVTVSDKVLLAINDSDGGASVSEECGTPSQDFVGEDECATAAQAAVGINLAFEAFNITSQEQAALVIGQMIAESGGFQMSRNQQSGKTGKYVDVLPPVESIVMVAHETPQDCSKGCEVGFFGKGTYSMWPPRSLALYAVMEGVVTEGQISSMSGEEVLALINGPGNPHAYGPAVWFLKHGKEALRPDEESCSADFGEQVDEGIIEPYFRCLHGPNLNLSETAQPQPYLPTLFSGIQDQDCAQYAPEEAAVVSYPAGVVPINEAIVSPPDLGTPSAATSVPGDDWVYSGFEETEVIVTTIGVGSGDGNGADGDNPPEEGEEEEEGTDVTESGPEDHEGAEDMESMEGDDGSGADDPNKEEGDGEGDQNDPGDGSGAFRLQAAGSLLFLAGILFCQLYGTFDPDGFFS